MFMQPVLYQSDFLTLCVEDPDHREIYFDLSDLKDSTHEHIWDYAQFIRKRIRDRVESARGQLLGCKAIDNVNYNLASVLKNLDEFVDQYLHDGLKEFLSEYYSFQVHELTSVELGLGHWIAYLSAPGYLDQTDPGLYCTQEEARDALGEMYSVVECSEHGWQEYDEGGCPSCQSEKEDNDDQAA